MGVFWSCTGLLLRVVSVRRCGNKWNGMKGMVGNVFGDVGSERGCCWSAWGLLYRGIVSVG
jgi:hypothetical protein